MSSEFASDWIVVYKGGPNNGWIARSDEREGASVFLTGEEGSPGPKVGGQFKGMPICVMRVMHTIGLERAGQIWEEVGVTGVTEAAKYEITSINGDVIVCTFVPE